MNHKNKGVYAYIADTVPIKDRSFRISFFLIIGSIANLVVTFACGYVIKYYGFIYVFATSMALSIAALLYTIFVIPESLTELRHKSLCQRIRSCSFFSYLRCFRVFFNFSELATTVQNNETQPLLPTVQENVAKKPTCILMMIVCASAILCLVQNGATSVFGLFLMDYPLCFDSLGRSHYALFSTAVSVVLCLLVSKFLRVTDLLICMMAVGTYGISFLFFIYGKRVEYVYIGAAVSSLVGLQYGFAKSAVSKSMIKSEVADALSSSKNKLFVFSKFPVKFAYYSSLKDY